MIIGGDGGEEGRTAGGASGTGYTGGSLPYNHAYVASGLDLTTWLSMNQRQQELWVQDWNRTTQQQNYSTDSTYAKVYQIKEKVDDVIIEPVIDGTEQIYEDVKGAVSYGFDTGVLLLAGAAILLLRK